MEYDNAPMMFDSVNRDTPNSVKSATPIRSRLPTLQLSGHVCYDCAFGFIIDLSTICPILSTLPLR